MSQQRALSPAASAKRYPSKTINVRMHAPYRCAANDPLRVEFLVDGQRFSKASMLSANADDEDVIEWVRVALPGDCYPALVDCVCVLASDEVLVAEQFAGPVPFEVDAGGRP